MTPKWTPELTPATYPSCNQSAVNGSTPSAKPEKVEVRKRLPSKEINTKSNRLSPSVINKIATRPAGLEPATYGLEIRCSIQLSYGRHSINSLQYRNFLPTLSITLAVKKESQNTPKYMSERARPWL